ncbi:hypothetical protein [Sphingobium fuliginis]|uniref:Conjugative transfer protein TrbI n=1 Tax=Sphingobium fuliginis (strain ATCC 27551) TaxID=336203 RepID=A0A292ZAK0_SPHSA|nr:hypothetical protein [Sphingobium fuliginis]GAY19976.1 conjugative transfer protein TrbI [Sphingobium fuliginis]
MEIGPNDALGAPRSLDVITPARNYPVFAGLQLNIKPTITIRPGFPVRVLVTRDLMLGAE